MRQVRKYTEVAITTLRSRWIYLWDQLLGSAFLVLILFVFVQLWRVTYAAGESEAFAGYSLAEIIWYLVATEAIIVSLPRIHTTLSAEVQNGDLAIRLNKPYNYLLFHAAAFLGDGMVRMAISLVVGGATAYLLVGGFAFRWEGLPALLICYFTTALLHFCYNASIGLAAFWVEDVTGLFWLLDRLKWLLGGMLLPVEIYPAAVRRVVEALPFQHMIAGPARLMVKFSWVDAASLARSQAIWLLLFGAMAAMIYRLGVRRVDLNGG